jgi:hypothetical protein
MQEVLRSQKESCADANETKEKDPISVFTMPEGWFAQEMRFVPAEPSTSQRTSIDDDDDHEDDGYLLFYAFDEAQLLPSGDVPSDTASAAHDASFPRLPSTPSNFATTSLSPTTPHRAHSELWVLSARDMTTLVARVRLPQRVPYGLHGAWFGKEEVDGQRGVERFRTAIDGASLVDGEKSWMGEVWRMVRGSVEEALH